MALFCFLITALSAALPLAQARPETPADATFYQVSYFEVLPSGRTAALAALKRAVEGCGKQDGCVRVEAFERVGRPGHLALIETWRDQKTFEAAVPTLQKPLLTAIEPIRLSGNDQRPYKTLAVAPPKQAPPRDILSVITHVDVSPSPQVPELLKRLAEASRQEEGNVRFDVLQHTMRANHFTVIETWRNQQALDTHASATHTRKYRDDLQPMTGSPLDERIYKPID